MRKKLFFMFITFALLTGCEGYKEGDQVETESISDFRVQKLFTVEDSISVYRFYDGNNHLYFVTGGGQMIDRFPNGDGRN